jgi:hypothetical protein
MQEEKIRHEKLLSEQTTEHLQMQAQLKATMTQTMQQLQVSELYF